MSLDVTTLALTCLALLGAGYLVVGLLLLVPAGAPAAREILPILNMEAVIVGTVTGAVWLGGWVTVLAALALVARTGYEAASVTIKDGAPGAWYGFAAGLVGLSLAASFLPLFWLCLLALAVLGAALAVLFLKDAGNAAANLIAFPAVPLVVLAAAAIRGDVAAWLLVAFFLVETFDSYALLGGKLFGRRKAFPALSPNKTVEGLLAGAVMLMLTAAIVGWLLADLPALGSMALALFAGVLTVTGDLAASRLKRAAGVKDYPHLMRHQGGLLDITDAWIATGAGVICLVALTGLA